MAPPRGMSTSLGVLGFLFLMVAVLSFTRARAAAVRADVGPQPLSVRNTLNGLQWIGVLAVYLGVSGVIHSALGRSRLELTAALVDAPVTAAFLLWSGWVLSAKRIAPPGPASVRHPRSGAARAYTRGRDGVRPASSTRTRRVRVIGAVFADDLRALLRHGRRRGRGLGGPRGGPRARSDPARRTTGRGRGPAPMGRDHRRRKGATGRRSARGGGRDAPDDACPVAGTRDDRELTTDGGEPVVHAGRGRDPPRPVSGSKPMPSSRTSNRSARRGGARSPPRSRRRRAWRRSGCASR